MIAKSLHPQYDIHRFQEGSLDKIMMPSETFDAVICSAVLHFAQSEEHFLKMWSELWRVLKPEGILFIRMASLEGMEAQAQELGNGQYNLPDGSTRFLLTPKLWHHLEETYQLTIVEPLKTVLVHQQRSMNVIVLRKN
jgi:tellurite methyltransferase